ncbi:hypothetical protein [Alicyclobacillus vulcanalis]|uniref:Uncharacterized protein n=1 Tax=Alicyclobacillus vulcanalis TaxID=252246 RepID=A0A1N7JZM7_9BACL|nr:hypothetical protein [Alicyclobacillus vulcanalis]SIS54761.1 hypothetical protein SAMN05421799_101264 [Alicyclobacillus vulcanalis]
MTVDVAHELLTKGCASLYRDVALCLSERAMDLPVRQGASMEDLHHWLRRLAEAEEAPIQLSGVRYALLQAFRRFKPVLDPGERHAWLDFILRDPTKARARAYELLLAHPEPALLTSYYWRHDPWRIAWFEHEGEWWQMVWHPATADCAFRTRSEVLANARRDGQRYDPHWLHEERLAVQFENGDVIYYPWLAEVE